MNDVTSQLIPPDIAAMDLLSILKTENPRLYNILSQKKYKFLIFLLQKIIKPKLLHDVCTGLNARLLGENAISPLENLTKFLYEDLEVQLKVVGREHLPESGEPNPRLLFASNHALGVIDGLTLTEVLCQSYGHAYFFVNRLVLFTQIFNSFFLSVGVFTRTNREESLRIKEVYQGNLPVSLFPAGLVSRKDSQGKLREKPWHPHFLKKAIEFKRDVVPVHMETENSKLFYGIHRLRSIFKIKMNLEMFLLLREAFSVKGKAITLHFGPPVSYKRIAAHFQSYPEGKPRTEAMRKLADKFCAHVESSFKEPLDF